MNHRLLLMVACATFLTMCAQKTKPKPTPPARRNAQKPRPPRAVDLASRDTRKAEKLIEAHTHKFKELEKKTNLAWWKASLTGSQRDYAARSAFELKLRKLHSDPTVFAQIKTLRKGGRVADPLLKRQLERLYWSFLENQIDARLMRDIVQKTEEAEKIFTNFRGKIGRKTITWNEILEILKTERRSSRKRRAAWEAGKQVGPQVAPALLSLVKLRNKAARSLGFANFYEMKLRTNEQNPARIKALFQELDRLTAGPFRKAKAELDAKLARRYRTSAARLQPWHYEDLFFQDVPQSVTVSMDSYFAKVDPLVLAKKFYKGLGFEVSDILARSDLYEKKGKDQHAYCVDIDRSGDIRVLANIKPSHRWTSTLLHELGHAIYFKHHERSLPYLLREPAHIFTTEAIAMLFQRVMYNPQWLTKMGILPPRRAAKLSASLKKAHKYSALIFARWTLVMVNFERSLYEDPNQDLNKLWWDLKERYQFMRRVPGRNAPDWATKTHICSAPAYYHNYMLGEMFASQLLSHIAVHVLKLKSADRVTFLGQMEAGQYLKEKLFKPGARWPWPAFVRKATGKPLSAKAFASQFIAPGAD